MGENEAKRLLKQGWMKLPEAEGGEAYLIGSKCSLCGYASFPKMSTCPLCKKQQTMAEIPLSRTGRLDTFAVAQQGSAGFKAPYIQAYVLLPEGVRIFTLIDGVEPRDDALQIGQEMEFTPATIRVDGDGTEIVGWKFKPASKPQGALR